MMPCVCFVANCHVTSHARSVFLCFFFACVPPCCRAFSDATRDARIECVPLQLASRNTLLPLADVRVCVCVFAVAVFVFRSSAWQRRSAQRASTQPLLLQRLKHDWKSKVRWRYPLTLLCVCVCFSPPSPSYAPLFVGLSSCCRRPTCGGDDATVSRRPQGSV